MAQGIVADILSWVSAHPLAAILVVFAVAVGESLFLFGLLIPGAIFMFAFGALVGAHTLSALAVFVPAIVGTLAGDTASYLLGRRYRGRLSALPGLSRLPGGIARGEALFTRHGGKAIILGRLIGALRPVVPTIAGAAGLSPLRFVLMDLLATALWAVLYIAPGVLVGASFDIAAQLVTRLGLVLLIAALLVWGITTLARFLIVSGRVIGQRYARALLDWSAAHRRLGLLGPALADPRQPETPALAVSALIVTMIAVTVALLVHVPAEGWLAWPGQAVYPNRLDAGLFWLVSELHTPVLGRLAAVVVLCSAPLVAGLFAITVGAILFWQGNWRAAAHWWVALLFSAAITLALAKLAPIAPPAVFFGLAEARGGWLAGGSMNLVFAGAMYGLATTMIAMRATESRRAALYSSSVAGLVILALAGIYTGRAWTSEAAIALVTIFVWVNLLALGYRRQRPRPVPGTPIAICFILVFVATAGLGWLREAYPDPATEQAGPPQPLADWQATGYARLPDHIETLQGRPGPPINVQAAGTDDALIAALARAGWHPAPPLSLKQALYSLVPDTPVEALAVWPTRHAGHSPALILVHGDVAPDQRWVLRLWASDYVLADNDVPVWLGLIDRQSKTENLHLMVTARDEAGYGRASRYLAGQLAGAGIPVVWPQGGRQRPLLFRVDRPGDTRDPSADGSQPMLK